GSGQVLRTRPGEEGRARAVTRSGASPTSVRRCLVAPRSPRAVVLDGGAPGRLGDESGDPADLLRGLALAVHRLRVPAPAPSVQVQLDPVLDVDTRGSTVRASPLWSRTHRRLRTHRAAARSAARVFAPDCRPRGSISTSAKPALRTAAMTA